MNKEDYFKYYIQGTNHYLIPKDVFIELFNEMVNWREEAIKYKETKQKEFILYLENEIYSIEPKGTSINYNCEYDSEEDYISAMKEQSKLNTLKEVLSKYQEIIGGKDEEI